MVIFTTITFDKCYIGFRFFANPSLVSKILSFHDCVIEGNGGANGQVYYTHTGTVEFDNCYFELNPSSPVVRGDDSTTVLRNCYFNGTGGFSAEDTSGQCLIISCGGTANSDTIKATGTLVLHVTDSVFQTTTLGSNVRRRYVNSTISGVTYREYNQNFELQLTDNELNTSSVKGLWSYKRTISVTVAAGGTSQLIADAYVDDIWGRIALELQVLQTYTSRGCF